MIQIAPPPVRADNRASVDRLRTVHCVFSALSLALWAWLVAGLSLGFRPLAETGWLEGALVVSALLSTMVAWSRQLPAQNVLLAGMIMGGGGALAQTIGTLTSIPFGPCIYTDAAGPRLLNTLPWWIPFMWVILLLNSRGTARTVLRPWRKTRYYGFRLLGLAAVLSLALVAGLESFAGRGKGCWVWGPTRLGWTWYGTPVTGFVGWGTTALLILAFATPALINKRPKELGPDYSSVAHWVLLDILFVAGAAEHQYWLAALFGSGTVLGVVCLALHGARR